MFRLIKSHTPGPYTFILPATRKVPLRFLQAKRKTIGFRIPRHNCCLQILRDHLAPLMAVSAIMPGDELPLNQLYDLEERLLPLVDLLVVSGPMYSDETTIIDLTAVNPLIIREGCGDVSDFSF